MKRSRCKLIVKNVLLTILGCVLLALGAVGVVIPVLPTTPFVLAAAICFSAGNSKLAVWLTKNRFFGPYIENYKTKQGVDLRLKVSSIIFVWVGIGISMIVVRNLWMTIGLCVIGIGVTVHLLLIKTKGR